MTAMRALIEVSLGRLYQTVGSNQNLHSSKDEHAL
jgi:hypothetical protein